MNWLKFKYIFLKSYINKELLKVYIVFYKKYVIRKSMKIYYRVKIARK